MLQRASPVLRLRALSVRQAMARRALEAAGRRSIAAARARLDSVLRTLQATGPQATLARGYAIVTTAEGVVLRDVGGTARGEAIGVRLWRGSLAATVTATTPAEPDASRVPPQGPA